MHRKLFQSLGAEGGRPAPYILSVFPQAPFHCFSKRFGCFLMGPRQNLRPEEEGVARRGQ